MPTVTLNKAVFEKLLGKKLSLEQLKDRLSMLGTDLEKIEGDEIHVEIFPNRPDLLSEQGLARALSSFIGVKTGLRKYVVKNSKQQVRVRNLPPQWPYAVACMVRGLKLNDERVREIVQLQEKLGTTLTRNRRKGGLGLYPLDKITFPVTFSGKKRAEVAFHPLGLERKMSVAEILEYHPKGREYGYLMADWGSCAVFTDAKGTIMSMPPIINANDVGKIDAETTDVFLEGTGPDLQTIKISLAILATALADMGGKIYAIEMVYPNKSFLFPDFTPRKMKLDLPYLNKRLGLNLKETQAKKLLERMGYGYEKGNALIPAYRADILHQVDLGEDVAIAYGYENFAEAIPNVATIGKQHPMEKFKRKVAEILSGLGMLEVNTYHLIDRAAQTTMLLRTAAPVEILDPVSLEYNTLRATMLASLLEVLKLNRGREYPQRIFDCGTVFARNPKQENGIAEHQELAVLNAHHLAGYTEALQQLDYLLRMLNIPYHVKAKDGESFIPGRSAEILVQGKSIGMLGELHPQVLQNFGLETPVNAIILQVSALNRAEE